MERVHERDGEGDHGSVLGEFKPGVGLVGRVIAVVEENEIQSSDNNAAVVQRSEPYQYETCKSIDRMVEEERKKNRRRAEEKSC